MDLYFHLPVLDGNEWHNHDTDMVQAFTAFGAEPPHCLAVLQMWQDDPFGCLIRYGGLMPGELMKLAIRWVKAVVPEYTETDEVSLPEAGTTVELVETLFADPEAFENPPELLQDADDILHDRIENLSLPYEYDTHAYDAGRSVLQLIQAMRWYLRWRIAQTDPYLADVDPARSSPRKWQARESVLLRLKDNVQQCVGRCGNAAAEAMYEHIDASELERQASPFRRKQIQQLMDAVKKRWS
jgi:hypothetical protein